MKDIELFNAVNNKILLEYDVLTQWEKTFLTEIQEKLMRGYPMSEKQQTVIAKVLNKKPPKRKRKKAP